MPVTVAAHVLVEPTETVAGAHVTVTPVTAVGVEDGAVRLDAPPPHPDTTRISKRIERNFIRTSTGGNAGGSVPHRYVVREIVKVASTSFYGRRERIRRRGNRVAILSDDFA